ncbi:MAG: SOS response-associated peptidase [Planctomycetota bacterium]|jgi:putative SOS response-associated peptidase YedK
MCGRYAIATPIDDLIEALILHEVPDDYEPRYNVAPTQMAPVVYEPSSGVRVMRPARFGFVPRWASPDGDGPLMINARSETVHERPAFREAFQTSRCLVPATGFYEWREEGKRKQPYLFRHRTEPFLCFAGVLSVAYTPRAERELSFAILTTGPNELTADIHDRMPVILDPDARAVWLDAGVTEAASLRPLLASYPADRMRREAVSLRVNSVRNDDPSVIEPAPTQRTLF